MSVLDWVILIAVVAVLLLAIRGAARLRLRGGCRCGGWSTCSGGCSGSCSGEGNCATCGKCPSAKTDLDGKEAGDDGASGRA